MHIITLGGKKELMISALNIASRITTLYEAWEESRIAPFRQQIDWCAVESYTSIESLLSALHHVGVAQHNIDAIIPVGETGIVPAAILGELIGSRSLPINIAMRCRDKALQKAAWEKANVPTSRWLVIRDVVAEKDKIELIVKKAGLTAPFIVKPLAQYGSRNMQVVLSTNKLAAACYNIAQSDAGLRCLLIEQFTKGKEWHMDGIFYNNKLQTLSIANYLQPIIENRHGKCLASVVYRPHANPELYNAGFEFAQKAISALGLTDCVFHLEAFTPTDDFNFVAGELAVRPGGFYIGPVVRNMMNIDLWDAHLKICLGMQPFIPSLPEKGSWGYTALACMAGKINQLKVEDLRDIPGVVEISLQYPHGQIMPDMSENSSITLGYALLNAETEDECKRAIINVQKKVIEINSTAL